MSGDITVVIPSIPPRGMLLARALISVSHQTLPAAAVAVAIDHEREGAGPTRTRALRMAQTEWVAFMDDDDELLPYHLETLMCCAEEVDADVIWPWFQVIGGEDPIMCNRGKQWNPATPHTFPMTTLVRSKFAQLGTFPPPLTDAGCSGEDFNYWMQMSDAGARFQHVNEITWFWHHDSGNTGGMPNKW